jgi:hypothetical protein
VHGISKPSVVGLRSSRRSSIDMSMRLDFGVRRLIRRI